MLRKLWKQVLTLSCSIIAYILGLYGEEIKFFLQFQAFDFIVNTKIFYFLAGLLLVLSNFLFFIDKSRTCNQKINKKSQKQKKFIKIAINEITIDDDLYKYDIDFLPDYNIPSVCQLRYYDVQTGLTEIVNLNALFKGKDPSRLYHYAQSFLNTQWDNFNKK